MKKVFGMNKGKESSPSIQDASDRMNQRGEKIDDKIKKLDAELTRYREQIKKTRPGPAQETMKARATRIHDQIRIYEGQRDALYSRTFKLDQVAFAAESFKDAQTRSKGQTSKLVKQGSFSNVIGGCCLPP